MSKFKSNVFYDMCVLEPYAKNTFELIKGEIEELTIIPRWKYII